MPTFELTSPDGTKYHIEGPEGATQEQAFQVLQSKLKAGGGAGSRLPSEKPEPSFMGALKNPEEESKLRGVQPPSIAGTLLATPEATMHMGSGMLAKPISDIAGLAATGYDMATGNKDNDAGGFQRYVQNALTYQPRHIEGAMAAEYNPLSLIGKGIGYGAHAAGEGIRGGESGDTLRGAAGNLVEEAIPQAIGIGGAKLGEMAKVRAPGQQAAMDIAKGENIPLDMIRNKSQAAGLTTPIEGNSWLAGIKGVAAINKVISKGNEAKVVNLIKSDPDINIPKGVAITPDELSGIRKAAGKAYQDVVDAGYGPEVKVRAPSVPSRVLGPNGQPIMLEGPEFTRKPGFQSTDEFTKKLTDMLGETVKKIEYDPETFRSLLPSARLLKQALRTEHDPKLLMDQIKQLRKDAATEFRSDNPSRIASAFTRKAIANEMENMIEANLEKTGKADLLQKFRDARRTIAKTYDIESALDPAGNINARKLYQISQKKPLSGNLDLIAKYAGAFPEGMQKVGKGGTSITPFDYMWGAASLAAGHPLAALGEIGGRVAVPMAAEKGLMQLRTPNYKVGNAARIAPPTISIPASQERQQ